MNLKASACGKCVLFGEHSILEGGGALVLPLINLKFSIDFTAGNKNELLINFPVEEKDKKQFWSLLEEDFKDVNTQGTYTIQSDLPVGAGLGSSAALCVALNRLFRKDLSLQNLIEHSWKNEFRFHGKSSGMDPTSIACEKPLHFTNPHDFSELKFPQSFRSQFIFVLFDSKIRRNTQNIVSQSHTLKETQPKKWSDNILKLQSLVVKGKEAIQTNNTSDLSFFMNEAHQALCELEVSNDELNQLRVQILEAGALGAKITGAGRGGFLLALFDSKTWQSLNSRDHSKLGSFFELNL